MVCLLHPKNLLLATIHQAKFRDLDLNNRARSAIMDIKDKLFWKAMYILIHAVFHKLWALRYCNSNNPAMDKIYYLLHQASVAVGKSGNNLNDETLVDTLESDKDLKAEVTKVFGENKDEMYASMKLSWYCLLRTQICCDYLLSFHDALLYLYLRLYNITEYTTSK